MTTVPMFGMIVLNLWAAGAMFFKQNYPLALVFTCYAVATFGLWLAAR